MRETPLTQWLFPLPRTGGVRTCSGYYTLCVASSYGVGEEVNGEENGNQEWSKLKHCLFDEFHML